ncbi:MAG: sugar transferase [Anaerolineales bacterium]|nr:sugar transferase [Anaerolineales bacterium]
MDEPRKRRWRLQAGERRTLLIFGDLIAASSATFIALYLWAQLDWLGFSLDFIQTRAVWFILLPIAWLLLMVNNYDVLRAGSWKETLRGVLISAAGGAIIYLGLYFFYAVPGSLPRRGIAYFLVTAVLFTFVWRRLYVSVFTTPGFQRRVLLIGAGQSGKLILSVIRSFDPPPFNLIGIIDDDPEKEGAVVEGCPILGNNRKLLEIIKQEAVSEIIVSILGPIDGQMFQAILDAQERGTQIVRMPVMYEELIGRLPIQHLESDWILRSFVDEIQVSTVYRITKRIIDVFGAIVGLIVLAVIFPWVALAIFIESGRPVLFIQDRLGKGGKIFAVVKFRTMNQDAEEDGAAHWAQQGDPRATKVGKFLRKTHIDEFPQFINVLKGEMSIVGPRPERPELVAELEKQIPFYRARLLVKPGITGWAQVNYGKGASIEGSAEKLEYDLYYIKHRNTMMDLWIVVRTTGSIIGFHGV